MIYSAVFTLVSFVSANVSSIIYDYPFHLGRIVGLAHSLTNKDLLPNLNYLFLYGSGYGLPMFYGNWMLYFPALVFLKTKVATFAFSAFVGQLTLLTVWSTYYVLEKMTADKSRSIFGAIAVSCSVTYFGFGMTAVVPLIPLLLYAIYKVLYKNQNNPILLAVVISLLVQTHIISTIVLAIFSAILVIFNVRRLSFTKLMSFFSSVIVSIFLLSGFILQYLEQNSSQTFFVSWKLRDFPFPSDALMAPGSIISILSNYYWPIIFIFLILSVFCFKYFDTYSRQLIGTVIIMFIFSSNILPWGMLRQTFLSVFQYTERLIYLLPVFVLMAIMKTAPQKIVLLVTVLQVGIYLYSFPMKFTFDTIPYSERGYKDNAKKIMDNTNRDAYNAFYSSTEKTYDTSGDEYLNIDIVHDNIRNGTIKLFEFDSEKVQITNIQHGYNRLDFDIELLEGIGEQFVVIPRIWYKGYIANYSQGANGTQPELSYVKKSYSEVAEAEALGKPEATHKVLYDGRAVINVSSSGHVSIQYKKTTVQWIGYAIQILSSLAIFFYSLTNKKRYRIHEKTDNHRPLL